MVSAAEFVSSGTGHKGFAGLAADDRRDDFQMIDSSQAKLAGQDLLDSNKSCATFRQDLLESNKTCISNRICWNPTNLVLNHNRICWNPTNPVLPSWLLLVPDWHFHCLADASRWDRHAFWPICIAISL